jgi:hypothetical protein
MSTILQQGFEAQAKRWKANDPSAGVIDMFCRDAFEELPDIFGEQEPE